MRYLTNNDSEYKEYVSGDFSGFRHDFTNKVGTSMKKSGLDQQIYCDYISQVRLLLDSCAWDINWVKGSTLKHVGPGTKSDARSINWMG